MLDSVKNGIKMVLHIGPIVLFILIKYIQSNILTFKLKFANSPIKVLYLRREKIFFQTFLKGRKEMAHTE